MTRDDRVTYVYLNLIDKKNRSDIYKTIEEMGITSTSTAQRTVAKIDKWSKSEKELFLATYIPTKSDSKAVYEVLGVEAGKVSSVVKEEPVSEDKCTECDIEAAHIINDLSAKNEELQKELHTLKKVIETLQNELCQQAEESRNTMFELCKERDEKAEEIRLLKLELQEEKIYRESFELSDRNDLPILNYYRNEGKAPDIASDFREIIEEMIQLYISKNKDYGNAFSQSYDEFGAVMALIRINDKLNRLKTLIKQDSEVKTESVKDTLIDLANYAVMTIIELERKNDDTY